MELPDWRLQVMWLVLTNQSASFQRSNATLKFVYDIKSYIKIAMMVVVQ